MKQQVHSVFEEALLESALDEALPELLAYWEMVFSGRADPGVRGFLSRLPEDKTTAIFRPLTYQESVAAAWLIRGGMHRRLAAAMATERYAVASPMGSDPPVRPDLDYMRPNEIALSDGAQWAVTVSTALPTRLALVENYSVFLVQDGCFLDFDHHAYPAELITSLHGPRADRREGGFND